ncbi:sigma-70 family RNA polymerase sigma factor [bacterium]|nr:sigma-70 family RNA polymerase sigma factor [bacterium]
MNDPSSKERTLLEHISTHWTMMGDPAKFVLRYAPAIRKYLVVILKKEQDAEDVSQDFLMKVLTKSFSEKQVTRGRFRDFLRVAIRNAACDHLRQKHPAAVDQTTLEETLADRAENEWIDHWRGCLLEKAWRRLDQFQRQTNGNLYYSVLRLATDWPTADSSELATQLSQSSGTRSSPESFRQQLHRARRKFAEFIIDEIKETIRQPTKEEVAEELRELGLEPFVLRYID